MSFQAPTSFSASLTYLNLFELIKRLCVFIELEEQQRDVSFDLARALVNGGVIVLQDLFSLL